MVKTLAKYTLIAVGIYLGVAYATGAGRLVDAGSRGYATIVKSLQGR